MRIQRRILPIVLTIAGALGSVGQAEAQFVVNWSFAPSATVPDNGSYGDVRTLGGFASYSNISVSLNLTSQTTGDPMFLGDMYSNLTLGNALAGETQRTAVLLNRPGRDNSNPFGSSASALNVTLDDSTSRTNVWASNGVAGVYNSDGRAGVSPNGAAVAFSNGDRNATLMALNGAALPSNRFTLLVADYAQGGTATLSTYGYGVTGAAASSGTLAAGGMTGTFSIGDTGSGAMNDVGAAVITTQAGGGALVVNIAGTMNMGGGVSGTSGLTKQGSGTLTLAGTGSYSGPTVIASNGGTLSASAANALGGTSGILVNGGGTLLLSDQTVTNAPLPQSQKSNAREAGRSFQTSLIQKRLRAVAGNGDLADTAATRYGGGSNESSAPLVANVDRINDAASVTLTGGGRFNTGGLSEGTRPSSAMVNDGVVGLGALTLSNTNSGLHALIDFLTGANGSSLVFSSFSSGNSGHYLDILNWTGTGFADNGASGNDRLLFANINGLGNSDLANIAFYDDANNLIGVGGTFIAYGGLFELVPVPEPGTWAAGALALLMLAATQWRRTLAPVRVQHRRSRDLRVPRCLPHS